MINSIVAHWNNRAYTKEESLDKIRDTFVNLENLNANFYRNWYLKGMSKKEALVSKVDIDNVDKYLKSSNEDMPEISTYLLSLWNGEKQSEKQISIKFKLCKSLHKQFPNVFILDVARSKEQQGFYSEPQNIKKLINIIVEIWNPDYVKIDDEKV